MFYVVDFVVIQDQKPSGEFEWKKKI